MFDPHLPLFTRGLSLFHGWLPLLLVWLLVRLGYDKRALSAWTVLAAGLVLVCYFFTPPAGAHLANPNIPININYVYGFNDQQPQHWVNQNLYVILWLGVLWLVAFLPTHLALAQNLRRVTAGSRFEACHLLYVIVCPPGLDSKMSGRVSPHSIRTLSPRIIVM